MPDEGRFNVVAAGALVLGGLAAVVLAVAVASKEAPRSRPSSVTSSAKVSGGAAAAPEDVEYQLDSDEPAK